MLSRVYIANDRRAPTRTTRRHRERLKSFAGPHAYWLAHIGDFGPP
jgi:hypothetical protein